MRWPDVVLAIIAEVEADAVLSALFPDGVHRAEDRDFVVPSLTWSLISDVEEENFNPLRIQFDVFTRTDAEQAAAEAAIRRLLHRDTPTVIGDVPMWSQYASRTNIGSLRDGIRGSASDFIFTPIRTRYVRDDAS